jgi:mannosylglycerate hydrolase MGH1-like protein
MTPTEGAARDAGAATLDPERARLAEARDGRAAWYRWGPYLSDRQWGTVREDYSAGGTAWDYLPHDHARSRAYRWGEDGLLGITDEHARLAFAIALWNERDPILKERLFGLTGPEGNHGEDVKEAYFYLDATPTGSYLRALYKYPQRAFPYADLVAENGRRGKEDPEYELRDTGVFDEDRYFDVEVEYAKAAPDDVAIRIAMTNRGPEAAPVHLLPTLWFRNTWSWGIDDRRPIIRPCPDTPLRELTGTSTIIRADHRTLGAVWLTAADDPEPLFTENESNAERLWGTTSRTAAVKDAFHGALVAGDRSRLAPAAAGGTKSAVHYAWTLAPGETRVAHLRLTRGEAPATPAAQAVDDLVRARRGEADTFYAGLTPSGLTDDERLVQRQAFAGLVWGKQYYHIDVGRWLDGDPAGPPPPAGRENGRNAEWRELNAADVISMPDPWEYPWFAAWDLAFHAVPFAVIDPEFAKRQLVLLTREWYMHPNGQLPAYEWAFSDVNPPVHAWATWRVYKIDRRVSGRADRAFLERVFHKLLLNFTWWVNRKDREGHNVFQGGFLGLDNIGVFDRSAELPGGGHLAQADGTAWMGFYSLQMMQIALELARENPVYEDVATKFFEHFLYIAGALNDIGGAGISLWDEDDGFFYDVLHLPDDSKIRLKVRSLVGLMPLLAVETLEPDLLAAMPQFARRLGWFLRNRPELAKLVASWEQPGVGERRLLALVHGHRMKQLLRPMLDEAEFLSPHGVRALSRRHLAEPYVLDFDGRHEVRYEPAESRSGLFGGNSNWRGPVWFPINYLLIEALQKFHHYYGDDFLVEGPTGSGRQLTLGEVAADLSRRLISIFTRDETGRRAVFGTDRRSQTDPNWRDHVLFYEYFDGDTGAGVGASHQTGWTALVAKLIDQVGRG